MSVDWVTIKIFSEALASSPVIVQEAFKDQNDRWNELLWTLAKLVKEDEPYDGETSDELLEILRQRLAKEKKETDE